jgi:hypothetical protein
LSAPLGLCLSPAVNPPPDESTQAGAALDGPDRQIALAVSVHLPTRGDIGAVLWNLGAYWERIRERTSRTPFLAHASMRYP